jgi:hypothetical protein
LDQAQQEELERAARQYAMDTLQTYGFDEDALYAGLRGTMQLHDSYEKSERNRLAEALKADLWSTVEFINFAFGTPTDEIANRAGRVGGYTTHYLELLFPNRRVEARNKVTRILRFFAQEHNRRAPNFSMTDNQIRELLDYLESTDLALFEYILVELNETYFARHSWQVAAAFLHLKSLASFPESLMKALLLGSRDVAAISAFNQMRNPGMGSLNQLVFQNSSSTIWAEYVTAACRDARTVHDFSLNLTSLLSLISSANTEEAYLGSNLSLATLLRNFTNHMLVENPALLRGQYVRCARAVLTTTFLVWNVAQQKGWI